MRRKERCLILLLLLFMVLLSCTGKQDPLVGRWTVDKVNVDFYEDAATPEMVRQFGEMEKGNILEISKDSVLTLIMDGDTLSGGYSFLDGVLNWNGELFGRFEDGLIKTKTLTPMGWVRTSYKKAGK